MRVRVQESLRRAGIKEYSETEEEEDSDCETESASHNTFPASPLSLLICPLSVSIPSGRLHTPASAQVCRVLKCCVFRRVCLWHRAAALSPTRASAAGPGHHLCAAAPHRPAPVSRPARPGEPPARHSSSNVLP